MHPINFPQMKTMATATPVGLNPDVDIQPESATAEVAESNSVTTESTPSPDAAATEGDSAHPWDQPIPDPEVKASEADEQQSESVRSRLQASLLPLLVVAAGLGVVVFCSTLYFLTRPCVIGECKVIPEAAKLNQKSTKTLQKPESGKAVLEAQTQLQDAISLLETIPPWSSHRAEAQKLIITYQAQAESVDQIVKGLQTAARAGYQSQDPPYKVGKWVEIQGMWREAIAELEQLPTDSKFKPLAKQKIKEYKTNLAVINQRLLKERQSISDIQAAKQAAQMAQARQGIAQSLADWQLAYASWQAALKRLQKIPQGTTAYEEAQQLSALYLPKLAQARDRKTQEQIAANAYNQGVRLAQLATDAQENNQWSVALVHWRNALTYANQVPRNTYYYGKAQALVRPYQQALKQAQTQLQLAVRVQQARSDLNQTCAGKIQVCSFTIDKKVIKVRLTPAYVQAIRQRANTAQAKGQSQIHAGIVNHILTLEKALRVISNNAAIPVEIYSPEGDLIQAHNPIT